MLREPAAGFPVRGIVDDFKRQLFFHPQFLSLPTDGIGIIDEIVNERFIEFGNMEPNPIQKLNGVQNLKILLLSPVQLRCVITQLIFSTYLIRYLNSG